MKRRLGLFGGLAVTLALSGCGFEPLYGRTDANRPSPVAAELASIRVAPIADRRGQIMRNSLEERLTPQGEPASPGYSLIVRLDERIDKLVFRRDASPTLANLTLTAHYQLHAANSEAAATSGTARMVNSFNISGENFATLAAEDDARERAVRELANEVALRLAAHFAQTAQRP